ncbi:MAG: fasciclin domain-containing protein [Myxococcota bacterium]
MNTWKFSAVLCGALLAIGCPENDDDAKDPTGDTGNTEDTAPEDALGTIVDVLTLEGDFTTVLGGAQLAAGLADALSDPMAGPFTVFAPTDDAFNQAFVDLGIKNPTDLIGNTALLTALLEYHVVEGVVRSTDITGPGLTTDTLNDLALFYAPSGGTVGVNGGAEAGTTGGADVTTPDLEASNGVVHTIDRVLLPPDVISAAIYATRSGNAQLGELAAALGSEGLIEPFQVDLLADDITALDQFTVLAPVDDGFPDQPPKGLGQILSYHVLSGAVTSSNLPAFAPTLATQAFGGTDLPLTMFFDTSEGVAFNGGDGGPAIGASAVATDITTLNGVVHVIDNVLLPLDVVQMAQVGGLDTLVTAVLAADPIGKTSVVDFLAQTSPVTVFAPSNDAFDTAFPGGLPADGGAITGVLGLHVVADGALLDAANLPAQADTITEATLSFDTAATPPTVTVGGGNTANIDAVDLGATNGVVHLIDSVLLISE